MSKIGKLWLTPIRALSRGRFEYKTTFFDEDGLEIAELGGGAGGDVTAHEAAVDPHEQYLREQDFITPQQPNAGGSSAVLDANNPPLGAVGVPSQGAYRTNFPPPFDTTANYGSGLLITWEIQDHRNRPTGYYYQILLYSNIMFTRVKFGGTWEPWFKRMSDVNVAAEITAHEAAENPHPQYAQFPEEWSFNTETGQLWYRALDEDSTVSIGLGRIEAISSSGAGTWDVATLDTISGLNIELEGGMTNLSAQALTIETDDERYISISKDMISLVKMDESDGLVIFPPTDEGAGAAVLTAPREGSMGAPHTLATREWAAANPPSAADVGAATTDHTHTPASIGAAATGHTHTPASIGAAATGHTHTAEDVGASPSNHTHTPASIGAATSDHTHTPASIGAATSGHTHTAADVGAAEASHNHAISDVTGLQAIINDLTSRIEELELETPAE